MVTSDLGACEWFVWDLRRSSLIDRGQLDTIVSEFLRRNPRAEAPALAEYLVKQGTLTAFQAERVLNGKTQGLVLGPYVLLNAIGSGSMGQVYQASSKNDNTLYAVKVLPRRSMWNVRLARRQVRAFGSFSHPAVVPFVDVGTAGGLHYLVWPLVQGTSLESVVQQEGKLSANLTALYGLQIAQGLTDAHRNNLFHGLVKPSNILIGGNNQACILDFGIGSLLVENEGESLVDTMSTANTMTSGLDCASPESIMDPTNRTLAGDQYSLGCVLYFCLTGRVPFPEGSAVEKMMAHQTKVPTPIEELAPDVPPELVKVVNKLMAKDPESRYTACDEVVEALEPFVGDPSAIPGGVPSQAPAPGANGSSGRMPGIGGSASRMPGVAGRPGSSRAMPGLPGRSAQGMPAPQYGRAEPVAAPFAEELSEEGSDTGNMARVQTPAPVGRASRLPGRGDFGAVPSRGANGAPAHAPKPAPTPELDSVPLGWEDEEGGSGSGFNLGPIGLVGVALVLMVAVYFGATLLMKQ